MEKWDESVDSAESETAILACGENALSPCNLSDRPKKISGSNGRIPDLTTPGAAHFESGTQQKLNKSAPNGQKRSPTAVPQEKPKNLKLKRSGHLPGVTSLTRPFCLEESCSRTRLT
jgi:hypothetical protein